MNSRILDDENSSPVRKFIDRNGRRKEEEEGQCSFATLEKDGNLFNKLHSEFRNFVSLSLFKKGIQRNEVEAEVHDCCELYNNERIFKKFRFENCKSLKFFIVRSERYSVEGVTRDFKKEHDTIIKGISSFSTLHLPGYGCPADVALGWKSMPLPMPLYRAVSTMVLKCLVYTSPGRFHLIFLCLRFDFYCYRRCTKNPENRLPRDPRCCADAGSTRFDLCRRTNKSRYEMKLSSIIKIIITFVQSKNYS